ncbi:MAG TPA: YibE/F family protein [Pseudonocardiaceae bacterium]|nr:YibE/F family protein [Pseudonocardiaceae bacterium]
MSATDRRSGRHHYPGAAEPASPGLGHGHGHGPAPPASRRVRMVLVAVLVPVALATLVGLWLTWPGDTPRSGADIGFGQRPVHGEVLAAASAPCSSGSTGIGGASQANRCISLDVQLTDGDSPGVTIQQVLPDEPSTPRFTVGDHVVLAYTGGNPSESGSYQVQDFQRGTSMLWLVALFVAAVLLLGRWRGLASLVALGFSFLVLVIYLFPALLTGRDPVIVGVLAASVIMFGVLYLTHGVSARTSSAVLGTVLSLALIGVLGIAFSAATQLTGLDDDTGNLIRVLGHGVDARGLLLAGMIIGALGVLDDVTVTQTSAVWELRRANPALGAWALYTAAVRIGRDHVSSAVNTLALAYAGAALPVLLTFSLSEQVFGTLITAQNIAQEVVRTLVGSIGLVAAVPITTAIAAVVAHCDEIAPVPS